MTVEEPTGEGQHNTPMEGEDITPKKDGGVLKVGATVINHYSLVWIKCEQWAHWWCGSCARMLVISPIVL